MTGPRSSMSLRRPVAAQVKYLEVQRCTLCTIANSVRQIRLLQVYLPHFEVASKAQKTSTCQSSKLGTPIPSDDRNNPSVPHREERKQNDVVIPSLNSQLNQTSERSLSTNVADPASHLPRLFFCSSVVSLADDLLARQAG